MRNNRKTIAAAFATILTSVSLYPVFIGTGWFWAGAGAVIMVAIAGTLTRLRRLPTMAGPAGTLIGLLLYLNLGFEPARSLLHVLPTPSSISHLWGLAGQGLSESARYAPPVPELRGMLLLVVGGIGLTAVFTDLIAVQLGSAALAGLPLLLLFTEPFTLSIRRDALGTTIAFCLGTIGYLTMLSIEGRERIRAWERSPSSLAVEPDTRALAAAGRRVGFASVVVALCVPLFVPGLHTTRLFGSGTPGIGGTGGSASGGAAFPDPETQLSSELREGRAQPMLEYQSSDGSGLYFQIYALDDLTNSGWEPFGQPESLASATSVLPSPPGLTSDTWATQVTAKVTISKDFNQDSDPASALPAPYPTIQVSAPGVVQADRSSQMIFDHGVAMAGLSYSVTSLELNPSAQALGQVQRLPGDIISHYLTVPPSYDPLRLLADSIVAGAKTPYAKAVALQEWLGQGGGGFSYTLNAPSITNASGLENFLDNTRSGYCQQFSFAMAVLARLVGVPSRVAVGFTPGAPDGHDTWLVTTHDAHAWPELYFAGLGWLRFEPTPTGTGGQGTATIPSYTQPASSTGTSKTSTTQSGTTKTSGASHSGKVTRLPNEQLGRFPYDDAGGAAAPRARSAGLNPWELAGLSLLALLALAAVTPGCAKLMIRHRRWRTGARGGDAELAHTAWRELRDDLMDYRGGYAPSESPRALASRVSAGLCLPEPAVAALRRITMAEERARYSARPADGGTLPQDATVVRRAIAAAAPRRTRWRARLFPSSVVTPVGIGVSQVTDLFSRMGPDVRLGRGKRARQVGPAGA
jgi:transglutaminase-like putative cysteine protease